MLKSVGIGLFLAAILLNGSEKLSAQSAVSEVTVADVLAGFRKNRQDFQSRGFRVVFEQHVSQDERVPLETLLRDLEALLELPNLPKETREEYVRRKEETMESLKSSPKSPNEKTYRSQFWVQDPVMHMQIEKRKGSDVAFRDVPVTSENLTTLYVQADVRWFGGDVTEGVHCWTGENTNGVFQAGIYPPAELRNEDSRLPPFAITENWSQGQVHLIDRFFDSPEEAYRLRPAPDGESSRIVLLQRREELRNVRLGPELAEYEGRMRGFDTETAWVDLSRGCLPVRIEWSKQYELDGKPWTRDGKQPPVQRLVKGVEIAHIEGLGYYPTIGESELFTRGASAVEETYSWKCSAPAPLADEMRLTLPHFPEGTAYFDSRAARTLYVGDETALLEQMSQPNTEGPANQPSGVPAGIDRPSAPEDPGLFRLILLGVNIVAICVAIWLFRLRRSKRP